jgi:hypothetical protein
MQDRCGTDRENPCFRALDPLDRGAIPGCEDQRIRCAQHRISDQKSSVMLQPAFGQASDADVRQ